jgi:hypothetical protein
VPGRHRWLDDALNAVNERNDGAIIEFHVGSRNCFPLKNSPSHKSGQDSREVHVPKKFDVKACCIQPLGEIGLLIASVMPELFIRSGASGDYDRPITRERSCRTIFGKR